VRLDLEARLEGVVVAVRDRGIGIPESDRPHLFAAFERGSNVGKTPGVGLGLAISKRAVEQLGGTIAVESVLGAGTTFTVMLPR
jgi:signal transduction histidine kinase